MRRKSLKIALNLVLLLCVGCNYTSLPFLSTPTPLPTATTTSTPIPTATPTPTPTPTPVPEVRVVQGDRALFIGDYDQALTEYQTAFKNAGDDDTRAAALVGTGRVQYLSGDCKSTIETMKSVVKDYTDSINSATAYFFLGQCYDQEKNSAAAAKAYAKYLQYKPGIIDSFIQELRGDALTSAGDYAGAIDAYEAAVEAPRLGDTTGLEIKIGQAYNAQGDYTNAIRRYMAEYEKTSSDYAKAQIDLLVGQAYLDINQKEQAYARFQDAVTNYPRAYDSYTQLVALVDDNQPVDDLSRGLVDYFVGQYGVAIDAFNRYIDNNPDHDGTAHHYKAFALRYQGQFLAAIDEWQSLIKDHPGDRFWSAAWDEIAYTQWIDLNDYKSAAQTLLDFINKAPDAPEAPGLLYEAARIQERDNSLNEAAATWERLITEYPSADVSLKGLFMAGISFYRLNDYPHALTTFQRMLSLSTLPADQAQAYFWIGKAQSALDNASAAYDAWDQASQRDPTGYYSERAREILSNSPPLNPVQTFDLGFDLAKERSEAEDWLRQTFNLPSETNLESPGILADDPRLMRGDAFWDLGLYDQSRQEFEAMMADIQADAANNFRLIDHLLDLGLYRQAIMTSRQVLDLANMDDASTLTAPPYFNHIRFGPYFKDIVLASAVKEDIPPLFLFSLIRQESLFESFAESPVGARGLMQIMPPTAADIVDRMGWPAGFTNQDLFRPVISIPMGAYYFARQRAYFDGDLYAALAAYNGGPGNTQAWKELSQGDSDLLLEVIRPEETRQYIQQIYTFTKIYESIYQRAP
jgi:soluble lytic murein transglycosylase